MTDDTLFQIGSISKTFTGTAMMRLVEQGKVELSAPLRRYLPEFRVKDADASARATVQDTLTHMGGWEGDFFADPSSGDDALQRQVEGMATLEQTGKPGEMWGYNNAGFYAAGRVIEVITGQPFEKALKAGVLDPLGLESRVLFPGGRDDPPIRRRPCRRQASRDRTVAGAARGQCRRRDHHQRGDDVEVCGVPHGRR